MPDKKVPAGNSMPRSRANLVSGCPRLAEEPAHFAALRRKMAGISQKVLTQQLRELQADGLVHRRAADRLAQPVVYSLTPYGRSLLPLVESVRRWEIQLVPERVDTSPLATERHTSGVFSVTMIPLLFAMFAGFAKLGSNAK
jgi:DNA-binding HxlR family transcriptional regulator